MHRQNQQLMADLSTEKASPSATSAIISTQKILTAMFHKTAPNIIGNRLTIEHTIATATTTTINAQRPPTSFPII
jgi:hypothetical protein